MQPTVFTGVDSQMTIAQEEVFGPVLSVIEFEDAEDAVRIANSTPYGLAAGVWTSNLTTAHHMVRAIRSGVVHVNCYGGASISSGSPTRSRLAIRLISIPMLAQYRMKNSY